MLDVIKVSMIAAMNNNGTITVTKNLIALNSSCMNLTSFMLNIFWNASTPSLRPMLALINIMGSSMIPWGNNANSTTSMPYSCTELKTTTPMKKPLTRMKITGQIPKNVPSSIATKLFNVLFAKINSKIIVGDSSAIQPYVSSNCPISSSMISGLKYADTYPAAVASRNRVIITKR